MALFSACSQEALIYHSQKDLCLLGTNLASSVLSRWRQTTCQLELKQISDWFKTVASSEVQHCTDPDSSPCVTQQFCCATSDFSSTYYSSPRRNTFLLLISPKQSNSECAMVHGGHTNNSLEKNWLQYASVIRNLLAGNVMTEFFLLLAEIYMWNHFCRKCLHWCLL